MTGRRSGGDVDYRDSAPSYPRFRRPDPRIAARIDAALGSSVTVLNVGAGAGGYEPDDRTVIAVEPSAAMRAQRPPRLGPAIVAVAEALPFAARCFDAAMTTFSVHQWADPAAGLAEMRRVSRGPVVVLTCDPSLVERFWLMDYAPEVIRTESRRYPPIEDIADALGGTVDVGTVPIPLDCTDGFNEAYYGRPEQLLDPAARSACSAWSFVSTAAQDRFTDDLGRDLRSGPVGRLLRPPADATHPARLARAGRVRLTARGQRSSSPPCSSSTDVVPDTS